MRLGGQPTWAARYCQRSSHCPCRRSTVFSRSEYLPRTGLCLSACGMGSVRGGQAGSSRRGGGQRLRDRCPYRPPQRCSWTQHLGGRRGPIPTRPPTCSPPDCRSGSKLSRSRCPAAGRRGSRPRGSPRRPVSLPHLHPAAPPPLRSTRACGAAATRQAAGRPACAQKTQAARRAAHAGQGRAFCARWGCNSAAHRGAPGGAVEGADCHRLGDGRLELLLWRQYDRGLVNQKILVLLRTAQRNMVQVWCRRGSEARSACSRTALRAAAAAAAAGGGGRRRAGRSGRALNRGSKQLISAAALLNRHPPAAWASPAPEAAHLVP